MMPQSPNPLAPREMTSLAPVELPSDRTKKRLDQLRTSLHSDKLWNVEELCSLAWKGAEDLSGESYRSFLKALKFLSIDEINSTNSRKQTALYCACRQGHVAFVKALLGVPGIDVDKGDLSKQSTPLHVAAWAGHSDIVAMLMWMGADTEIRNFFKLTAKEEAQGDAIYVFPLLYEEGLVGILKNYPEVLELGAPDYLYGKSLIEGTVLFEITNYFLFSFFGK
eukprot:TRINITY_DN8144_c0_g1_i3.p1 TRINITY_DN8144_c0_g1~~TRINITY_DN8144_c0_g1_i3.p1  ORF type:complete len:223 (+),score=39.07 TRINITY_DN8144_c0_g1_i3:405-1073(+)